MIMSELDVKYTVWVGGTEVNDYLLTYEQAKELADSFKDEGYDDVHVQTLMSSYSVSGKKTYV